MLTTIRQALDPLGSEQHERGNRLAFLALFTSLLEIVAAALMYVLLEFVANPSDKVEIPVIRNTHRVPTEVVDNV